MKAPKQPSVGGTAQAQGAANRDAAISQQLLNMTNQVTPYGDLTYAQSGTGTQRMEVLDSQGRPTGKFQTIKTPTFTATTTLSPAQQALLDQEQQFDKRFNEIALDQTGRIGSHLAQPFTLDNNAIEGRIGELARARLDPLWEQREGQFEQKMANQGISPGSQAYMDARRSFDVGRNNSYNSLLRDARGQAMSELLTARNQPINEITALMGGAQVQRPQFASTPQTGVAGVDVAGLTGNNFANRAASHRAMLGGLSELGAAALGGWALSDRRVKKDVKNIGRLNDGTGLYSFRYRDGAGDGSTKVGVMAQEIEDRHPYAVAKTNRGIKAVNYSALAEALRKGSSQIEQPRHWTQAAARLAQALVTGLQRSKQSAYGL